MAIWIYVIAFIIFSILPLPLQIILFLGDTLLGGIGIFTLLMIIGIVFGRMIKD